jgi:hypothetical protein
MVRCVVRRVDHMHERARSSDVSNDEERSGGEERSCAPFWEGDAWESRSFEKGVQGGAGTTQLAALERVLLLVGVDS